MDITGIAKSHQVGIQKTGKKSSKKEYNSKYRKTIWQCNHKFDGGEKCGTPHLDEETIKSLFLNQKVQAKSKGIRQNQKVQRQNQIVSKTPFT